MSANPFILNVIATPSVLQAVDAADARFSLFATLLSGVLCFEVVTRLPTGERGSVSGRNFFAAMMNHFGPRVRTITGVWDRASGLTANLDQFNRAIASGLPPEAAAALTWTGLRASEYGFDRVKLDTTTPPAVASIYDFVRVEFSR